MTTTDPTLDAPLVGALRDGIHLVFWCDHCDQAHRFRVCTGDDTCRHVKHGTGECTCPIGSGDGHREPECTNPRSPYLEVGHILYEVTRHTPPARIESYEELGEIAAHAAHFCRRYTCDAAVASCAQMRYADCALGSLNANFRNEPRQLSDRRR